MADLDATKPPAEPVLVIKPDEVILNIATPNGMFEAVFRKKTTVGEVINIVVDDKKLDKKDSFELVHKGEQLLPATRTLENFHLHQFVKVELVATGSGSEMPTLSELTVEEELANLREIAELRGWVLRELKPLHFFLAMSARDGSTFNLFVACDDYPVKPPAWHWCDGEGGGLDKRSNAPDGQDFLHSNGVICAPWNRLSYKEIDPRGPHTDWVIADWRNNSKTGGCKTLSAMAIRTSVESSVRTSTNGISPLNSKAFL